MLCEESNRTASLDFTCEVSGVEKTRFAQSSDDEALRRDPEVPAAHTPGLLLFTLDDLLPESVSTH
jgi:hypothetical protein